MIFSRLPLHLISRSEEGFFNQDGLAFDADFYSRFKYGCSFRAALYAGEMSDKIGTFYSHWKDEEVFITGSAYKVAPTASGAIADRLFECLLPLFPNLQQVKINRESIFPNEYGRLSMEERMHLMERNQLSVDVNLLRGKKLIVVDDLWVTGAHEQKVVQLMSEVVDELLCVYVGQLTGEYSPNSEAVINQAAIKSVYDLLDVINSGGFKINARVCKYLLSYENTAELENFLYMLPQEITDQLYTCICGDGYHRMSEYEANFSILQTLLKDKTPAGTAA